MKVERLVIDSSVWIAALIFRDGTARQLVDAVLDLDIDILMSESARRCGHSDWLLAQCG